MPTFLAILLNDLGMGWLSAGYLWLKSYNIVVFHIIKASREKYPTPSPG
jgi:hypothetical protein